MTDALCKFLFSLSIVRTQALGKSFDSNCLLKIVCDILVGSI